RLPQFVEQPRILDSDDGLGGNLDHCPVCASVHLVRRLGEVECRDCGAAGQLGAADAADVDHGMGTDSTLAGDVGAAAADLANEVERALSRVLGPSRQRPPYAMS
ncbi:MAG: hypothetical protein ACLQFR_11970, partial [Streptosporangiaceae bacterium]